jgi:tight adherence protein B
MTLQSKMARVASAVVLAALAVALSPSAALAEDPSGRIDHAQADKNGVQVLFSVPGLAGSTAPDPDSVAVTVAGRQVEASAERVAGTEIRRTSILALDVSKSMSGAAFEAAKNAAATYLDNAPVDVNVGLVTFANSVTTVQEPTQDHDAVRASLGSLELSLQTSLYDGLLQAVDLAGTEGSRSVLLLSDGKDTTDTVLDDVLAIAEDSGVRVDVVALDQKVAPNSPLDRIADATGGTVTLAGDPKELEALFAGEADDLTKQLLVSFELPEGFSSIEGTVRISAQAGGQKYTDQAFVSLAAALPQTPSTASDDGSLLDVSKPLMLGGLVAVFVGLTLMLALGMSGVARAEETPLQKQLSMYTVQGLKRAEVTHKDSGPSLKESAVGLADRLMSKRDFEAALSRKLDAGGISLTAAEWVLLHIGVAVGAAMLGMLLSGGGILPTLLLLVLGLVLPWVYLGFKESRRLKKFNGQLAQTLQIMAGGLQAGLSLPQAVDTVVQEGADPVAAEFRRALVQQRLGVDIEDALEEVAERMKSVDFKWVVMAIRIQREVGGNLSELLLTVSATLREREYLRRQVSVLSAEGRLSALILGGLPPFFVGYLALARPTYLAPMLETRLGWIMLGGASVMMIVGAFWLKKTVKVEV